LRDVLVRLDFVFQRLGRDVLSACGDDDVFLSIGDREKSIAELTDVPGVEPPSRVDRFARSL